VSGWETANEVVLIGAAVKVCACCMSCASTALQDTQSATHQHVRASANPEGPGGNGIDVRNRTAAWDCAPNGSNEIACHCLGSDLLIFWENKLVKATRQINWKPLQTLSH
jgi:hypothetical protein